MRLILLLCLGLLCLGSNTSYSQDGQGSMTLFNERTTLQNAKIYAELTVFGPATNLLLNGSIEIHSKYIWIHPDARIYGPGKIVIKNPATNPYYPSMTGPSHIDHNDGTPLEVNLEIQSTLGLHLQNVTHPRNIYDSPAINADAHLNVNRNVVFSVAQGHVYLQGK